ncbi:hypothetical protein M413DRAFT_37461, partial [Hebeloma cylindrosporum]
TLRRHMAARHRKNYRRWCKVTNFESMLPEDTRARREALLESLRQTNVTDHFTEAKPAERVAPYTDELFKEAAIQWLVETDQPISAFDNPAFQNMMSVAARATRGIKL